MGLQLRQRGQYQPHVEDNYVIHGCVERCTFSNAQTAAINGHDLGEAFTLKYSNIGPASLKISTIIVRISSGLTLNEL